VGEGARGSDSLTAPGSNARRYRVLTLRSDGRLVVQLKDSWDWGEGPAEGTRERKLSLAEASQQFGPKIVRRAFRKYVEGRPDYYGETIK
jgi:hypothetical protein